MSATPIADAGITAEAFVLAEMSPLSSLGDDSQEARSAATILPRVIEACLRAADWSFASRLLDLPEAVATTVDETLPYACQLPSSVLAVREVRADLLLHGPRWRIDGRVLRVDVQPPVRVRVTSRVERESELAPEFRDWCSHVLAVRLARSFASSANRAADLETFAERARLAALRADRTQASSRRWDGLDDDWRADGDWVRGVLA